MSHSLLSLIQPYHSTLSADNIDQAGRLLVDRTGFAWSQFKNSLALAMNLRYAKLAHGNSQLSAVLAPIQLKKFFLETDPRFVFCASPEEVFYHVHATLPHQRERRANRIAGSARISSSAVVAAENVTIGENVEIGPFCYVGEFSIIGNNSVLEPRVTIGTEGLFAKSIRGQLTHVLHHGGVKIGDNCFIHSGVNIARSVMKDCVTQIDDHVHIGPNSIIGHDSSIGEGSRLSAQAGVAGRAKIGRNVWMGMAALVTNELEIGDSADIKAGAVVIADVAEGDAVSGNFAISHSENLRRRNL